MKRAWIVMALVLALLAWTGGAAQARGMKLTSRDVKAGRMIKAEQVFKGFGCTGRNISPELSWSGAPTKTKSFALTLYDPDAPTGSGWWHWVVFNIPASVHSLAKNAGDVQAGLAPAGAVQSRTDFGTMGYGGPCPPKGDKPHRYVFTLYALDVDHLAADANASAAFIGFNLHFHTLAKARLTAKYGR